ncbi:MAG: hypothetical protein ACOC3S_01340 [Bacteroidota bacterium]
MLNLTDEQKKVLENCANHGFDIHKTCNVLMIPVEIGIEEMSKENSEFRNIYNNNKDLGDYEILTHLLERAKKDNKGTAAKAYQDYKSEMNYQKIRHDLFKV